MKDSFLKNSDKRETLRQQVIGLGERSFRKNYYSDLKHSRLELQRFRAVLEDIPDIIIVLDKNGIVLDLNKTAVRMLKRSRSQLIGESVKNIDALNFYLLDSSPSESIILEEEIEEENETNVVSRIISLREVPLEQENLYVVIGRDVSSLIKAENELKSLNQDLEKAVQDRTVELRNKIDLLKSTQQQLINSEKMALMGELVAGVAHEINTPLGVGVTASSSLWTKINDVEEFYNEGELTEEAFREFLAYLKESSALIFVNMQRASELIQSFKRVAVDQSSEAARSIDFGSYLKDVVQSLKPQWKNHQIHISDGDRLDMETIPGIWSQILSNLIINSISHGFKNRDQDGEIKISYQRQKGMLDLLYWDNGTGIADQHLTKLFEPFFTTSRQEGGSGLGLHIVYNLVTLKLKGKIEHFRPDSGGAGFKITVPLDHINPPSAEHTL